MGLFPYHFAGVADGQQSNGGSNNDNVTDVDYEEVK